MLKGEKWFELGYNETSEKKWNHADEIYLNQIKRAEKLLKRENETHKETTKTNKKSEDSWLDTVVEKGTMSDRLSAIQLKFQKDPIHSLGYLERIVSMLEKNKKRDAVNLLKCVKEIMIKELLPPNRKLIAFDMRPLSDVESLSSGNVTTANKRLMLWKFEDDLKKLYQRIVIAGQTLAATPVEGVAEQVCIVLADLLIERPEQEQFLLSVLVSKLGHPQKKVDVMVARQLERLLSRHPNMRMTVALELERLIFRKNMSNRARFYAIHSLTIIPLRSGDSDLALKLLKIYFSLFRIIVTKKTTEKNSKFLAAVIRGANIAFPHAKERTSELGVELNELYKIVHEAPNLSTSLNALKLLYQMLTYNSSLSDRFYASLYQRMLRIRSSKNDTEFFKLMHQVLRSDTVNTRIRAFIKRLLQLALNSTPSFAASALILYSSLLTENPDLIRLPRSGDSNVFRTRLSNSLCIKKEESNQSNGFNFDDDDEEEHYEDVKLEDVKPLNSSTKQNSQLSKKSKKRNNLGQVKKAAEFEDIKEEVQPKIVTTGWVHREKLAKSLGKQKGEHMESGIAYTLDVRNPLFAHADMSTDTELILLSRHYHPSVAYFASCVIEGQPIKYKGDALIDFTLIRFLDRFAFKNPKLHRASEDGGDRRGYNPKGVKQLALTSSEYANKSINEIPSDERFLHRFAALKMRAKNAAKQTKDGEDVGVKKEEPDEETMSVDSDEFERVMEKFEPGEANDFFEWDDVDFTQEFGQELNKKQAKAKRKQKKREESAANVNSDESEGEMELDSEVDGDEITDDELNEEEDDYSENEMEGSDEEVDGSDGSSDVEMENESSGSETGQNYEYDVESEDDEEDFKPKRLKKIPKRGYQETDSEGEN